MNQEGYKALPIRSQKRSDGTLKTKARGFCTNTFQIQPNNKVDALYQYDFKLYDASTEVVKNSKRYGEAAYALKDELSKKLGFLFSRGQTAYCTKDSLPTTILYIVKENNKQLKLQAIFKKVKEFKIKDLFDSREKSGMLRQIFNSILKNKLDYIGMVELGKSGKYYDKKPTTIPIQDKSDCIYVMKGYKLNILPYQNSLLIQAEPSFRILQSNSLLSEFKNQRDLTKFVGKTVTANYGTFRNYKILEIVHNLRPNSLFQQESGVSITYKQYMFKNYKKIVENEAQPLIKVLLGTKKFIREGNIVKEQVYGHLIPQFVSLAGLKDSQMKSFHLKQSMSKVTKLSPNQAIEQSKELIEQIQHNDLFSISNTSFKTQGYRLPPPSILFKKSEVKPDQETGKIKMRQKLASNPQISDYLIVHSIGIRNGKKEERDYQEIDAIFDSLSQASKSFEIKLDKPGYIEIERGKPANYWISQVEKDCKENGSPRIIIFIFNRNEQSYYQPIKSFCSNTIKCHSQVITRQKFKNDKGRLSIASKIMIQICSKLNFSPYKLKSNVPLIEKGKKNVMIGGITLTKGKHGSYVSFVGNTSADFTKYKSACRKINSFSNIPSNVLEQIFKQWAKKYFKQMKAVPDYILILRQGANEIQLQRSIQHCEIPALQNTIKIIGQNTKTKNYDPCRQIVLVNSRISQKFFTEDGESKTLKNPQPGSLITEDLDRSPSFNLISHHATKGIANPIKYKVVYQKAKISQQSLVSIIYEQSYNYYNWDGPVKVPSCLQYANKLGKQTSMHLGADQSEENPLSDTLYYL